MASQWFDRWKKQKPKTLFKEPLSDALKELDTAADKLEGRHSTKDISVVTGAVKQARIAVKKTEELCNPKLHRESLTWLGHFDTELQHYSAEIQTQQEAYNTFLKELQRRRDGVVQALQQVPNDPSPNRLSLTVRLLEAFLAWFTKQAEGVIDNHEAGQANKYVSVLRSHLMEMEKTVAAGGTGQPVWTHQMNELQDKIVKLDAPGGFPLVFSQGSHGSIGV